MIKVLHFSPHDEDCGVGKYQENYLKGMAGIEEVENTFFDSTPYKTRVMTKHELAAVLEKFKEEAAQYDIIHIQHEFGLFWFDQFRQVFNAAKSTGKKVVVTVHLSPSFAIKPVVRKGVGPRSFIKLLLDKRNYNNMVSWHIVPMRDADLVISHNDMTAKSLEEFGVPIDKIKKLTHPVYAVSEPPVSKEIAENLNKKSGDTIYCITGFLHRFKGVEGAIRSLKYLPDNYKLALIGGVKADSDEVFYQDKLTDLIDTLNLKHRVYITGYVTEDERLNALIRECDVCIYPYDRTYYSSLSSGSLNLALANSRPVIAYPTESFKEVRRQSEDGIVLTKTFAYYEIARELKSLNIQEQTKRGDLYASKMAWPKQSKKLVSLYLSL